MSASAIVNQPAATANSKKLLLLAVVLGMLAALMNWMSSAPASNLTVLKAKRQILAGTAASDDMFERVTISGKMNEMRSLVVDAADFQKAFRGRTLTETLEPGQLLLLRSFDLTGGEVRDSIRPGQRAISLDVPDEAQAVAYFIRPGDGVDVWATINGTAYRLKEGACVRAIGEGAGGRPEGSGSGGGLRYRTVTLVVPEADMEGLVANLGLAEGNVRLSLIGPCDPKNEKAALAPVPMPERGAPSGQSVRTTAPPASAAPTPQVTLPTAPPPSGQPEQPQSPQPRTPMTKQ